MAKAVWARAARGVKARGPKTTPGVDRGRRWRYGETVAGKGRDDSEGAWGSILDEEPAETFEVISQPNAVENASAYRSEESPQARLRLPVPDAPAGRRSRSAPLPDAVPKALFDEPPPAPPPPPSVRERWAELGARKQAALAGAAALALLLLAVAPRAFAPRAPPLGMVTVVSEPEGARVFLDGQDTGQVTPASLYDLELGRTLRLQIKLDGHRATPDQQQLTVEQGSTAYFRLEPVQVLRIETDPPGAEVRVGGRRVMGRTPLNLPAMPEGAAAQLEIELEGHVPVELEHRIGAPLPVVSLVPGARLNVTSNPSGATARIDARVLGTTPVYDALVPRAQRLVLTVELRGYRPAQKTIRLDGDRELNIDLKEMPVAALGQSPAAKREGRRLDQALATAEAQVRLARSKVAAAERLMERSLDDPRATGGERARADQRLAQAQEKLDAAEDRAAAARADVERFRAQMLETR